MRQRNATTVARPRATPVERAATRIRQRADSILTETPSVVISSRSRERRVREPIPRYLLSAAWSRRRDHPVRQH